MNKDKEGCMQADKQKELANELKNAFDAVSPFIEKHTSIVCPTCETVCCINKHGNYDNNDRVFIEALGMEVPRYSPDRKDTDPCRFLKEHGCSLERWVRPYRCTFFFCDLLLKSLEGDNAKLFRAFTEFLKHLVSVRQQLLE